MTKQDVIKQAYQDAGVDWDKYSARIDIATGWMDFGYCCNGSSDVKDELDLMSVNIDNGHYYNSDHYGEGLAMWRPKSLAGIEDNNGWNRIDEVGLPKEDDGTKYNAGILEGGKFIKQETNVFYSRLESLRKYFTHYQPINKPSKPLY